MNRAVVIRLFETFFRRWYLYIALLLLFCAVGVASVASSPKQYQSGGVISASRDTLLSGLSTVSIEAPFTFDTPATFTSRNINERMRTNEFALTVADRAGLRTALETGAITLADIRNGVSAGAQGDNLLFVRAIHSDPQVAFRLATSTIESFIDAVIADDLNQSAVAENFYQRVADSYAVEVDNARADLTAYLRANPAPFTGERPESEVAEVDRLDAALTRIEGLYAGAISRTEDARLVTEQTRIDVAQRLRLVDVPVVPAVPLSGLRAAALTLMLYVALGSLVTAAAVALASFFDHTIRRVDEVEARFGVAALAAVPRAAA